MEGKSGEEKGKSRRPSRNQDPKDYAAMHSGGANGGDKDMGKDKGKKAKGGGKGSGVVPAERVADDGEAEDQRGGAEEELVLMAGSGSDLDRDIMGKGPIIDLDEQALIQKIEDMEKDQQRLEKEQRMIKLQARHDQMKAGIGNLEDENRQGRDRIRENIAQTKAAARSKSSPSVKVDKGKGQSGLRSTSQGGTGKEVKASKRSKGQSGRGHIQGARGGRDSDRESTHSHDEAEEGEITSANSSNEDGGDERVGRSIKKSHHRSSERKHSRGSKDKHGRRHGKHSGGESSMERRGKDRMEELGRGRSAARDGARGRSQSGEWSEIWEGGKTGEHNRGATGGYRSSERYDTKEAYGRPGDKQREADRESSSGYRRSREQVDEEVRRHMSDLGNILDDPRTIRGKRRPDYEAYQGKLSAAGAVGGRGNVKLGIDGRAIELVANPQLWPHQVLGFEFVSSPITYNQLDFRTWVTGELEIVLGGCCDEDERTGRLRTIKELAYGYLHSDWQTVSKTYAAFVRGIERGDWGWRDHHQLSLLQMRFLAIRPPPQLKPAKIKVKEIVQGVSTSAGEGAYPHLPWWCREYQKGKCGERDTEHMTVIEGIPRLVKHICSDCLKKDDTQRQHPKGAADCPHNSNRQF
jgi:hypothetical protein